jgi:hypothetical protein
VFAGKPEKVLQEDVFMDRSEKEDEPMDYERLCASGEALVYAAMIRLMTRRLTHLGGLFIQP